MRAVLGFPDINIGSSFCLYRSTKIGSNRSLAIYIEFEGKSYIVFLAFTSFNEICNANFH